MTTRSSRTRRPTSTKRRALPRASRCLAPSAVANAMGFGQSLCEMDRMVRGATSVVLVGDRGDARTKALAVAVFARWIPNRMVAWLDPADPASRDACALLADGKELGQG